MKAIVGTIRHEDHAHYAGVNTKECFRTISCPHCGAHVWDEGDPRRARTKNFPTPGGGKSRSREEVFAEPVVFEFPCYTCGEPIISTFGSPLVVCV